MLNGKRDDICIQCSKSSIHDVARLASCGTVKILLYDRVFIQTIPLLSIEGNWHLIETTFKNSYIGSEYIVGCRSAPDKTYFQVGVWVSRVLPFIWTTREKRTCVLCNKAAKLEIYRLGFPPTFLKWAFIRGSLNSKTHR